MNTTLLQLQSVLRDRFPEASSAAFQGRDRGQDEPRLQPGRLVEITGQTSGQVLRQCMTGKKAALIDGADAFEPAGIEPADLRQLLWVPCRKATEAIRAADLLLRDGNLPVVLLDLRLNPQRGQRGQAT
jgi:hypothetical protein